MINPTLHGRVIDIDRVHQMIDDLTAIEKDKAIKEGLKAAALTFLEGGKRRLRQRMKRPEGVTGNLLRSFHVRIKREKLGALAGFRATKNVERVGLGYHAHLVDRGTVPRFDTKHKNANRGIMPGLHFWTDAVEQDADKAIGRLYDSIEIAVSRIKNRNQ